MYGNKNTFIMKISRIIYLSIAAFIATACSKSESEYHYFNVSSPSSVIYADQYTDTLGIESTDSWKANTDASWFTPTSFSFDIGKESFSHEKKPISITPNTSGTVNGNYMTITSDGRTYRKSLIQVYWLNIVRPDPIYKGTEGEISSLQNISNLAELKAEFTMTKNSDDTEDNIIFNLYDRSATLSTPDSWITLGETSVTHTSYSLSQQFKVSFTMETNSTGADRTGTITITTANGAKTDIKIIQKG